MSDHATSRENSTKPPKRVSTPYRASKAEGRSNSSDKKQAGSAGDGEVDTKQKIALADEAWGIGHAEQGQSQGHDEHLAEGTIVTCIIELIACCKMLLLAQKVFFERNTNNDQKTWDYTLVNMLEV